MRAILDDYKDFCSRLAWYTQRGVPYRRGYLLTGKPGCGKTHFTKVLAGSAGADLYTIDISSSMGVTDDNVSDIFRALPPRSILLLKNIDTAVCKRGAKGDGKDGKGGGKGAVKEEAEAAMPLGVVSCSSESSWCSSATATTTATGTSPSTPATRTASAGSPSPVGARPAEPPPSAGTEEGSLATEEAAEGAASVRDIDQLLEDEENDDEEEDEEELEEEEPDDSGLAVATAQAPPLHLHCISAVCGRCLRCTWACASAAPCLAFLRRPCFARATQATTRACSRPSACR